MSEEVRIEPSTEEMWEKLQGMKPEIDNCALNILRLVGVLAAQCSEKHECFSLQHLLRAVTLSGLTLIEMAMQGRDRKEIEGALEAWVELIRTGGIADTGNALTPGTLKLWVEQGKRDLDKARAERAIGAALSAMLHQPKTGDTVN